MDMSDIKNTNPEFNPEELEQFQDQEIQDNEIAKQEVIHEAKASDPDYKELLLRTNADFQNFKRRVERERTEWTSLMQSSVIEKILPFVSDLERAIQAQASQEATPGGQPDAIKGFELILKNLKKTLKGLGVEEIPTTGQFNPELHEALMHVESADHASGDIVQELSKGYTHKGKVLTHARVSVAK